MKFITETAKMIAFTELWDEICKKRFKVKMKNLEDLDMACKLIL